MRSALQWRGWAWLALGAGLIQPVFADELEAGFASPPAEARPRTWWYWMNGCVTKEGITADLEAMKAAGLAEAQMFTVQQHMIGTDGRPVQGDVLFMSPRWREMVRHALVECHRLGLEFTVLTCEGWGQGGGRWVKPAESMQKVVWSTAQVVGGRTVPLAIERPMPEPHHYTDIALLGFPTAPGEESERPPLLSASATVTRLSARSIAEQVARPAGGYGGAPSEDSEPPLLTMPLSTPGKPQWVLLDYGESRVFSSVFIAMNHMRDVPDPENWGDSPYLDAAGKQALARLSGPRYWELQSSDDGRNFRSVGRISTHGTTSFPETRARYFRLWLPVPPPLQKPLPLSPAEPMEFTHLHLAGPRLDRPEFRNGQYVDWRVREFSGQDVPAANVVARAQIVDLTGLTSWDAPPGNWTLLRLGHAATGVHIAASRLGGLEADKLSRQAVLNHLDNGMIGTVLTDAGPLAGRTLKHIVCDSWERGYENWTPLMREEFARRRGYAIEPWLPALTGRVVESVEASERFLWDFRRTIADLLAENYYGTLREYANRRGLTIYAEATGHGMPAIADQLQCKGRTDFPMGEFWAGRPHLDDAKEAASAAHIYGQNIAATESFTSIPQFAGWRREPVLFKAEGDLRLCVGINRLCFQCFAHQPWLDRVPGMSIGRWGSNLERNNTWWRPAAAAWISYLSRSQFLLQRGRFVADVVYFYGEDAPVDFRFSRLKPEMPAGYDFDVCNAEILRRFTVKDGSLELPSGMRYRVLVLPENDRMTLETLQVIQALVRHGATVMGPRPNLSPSLVGWPDADRTLQTIAAEVWGDCDGRTVTSHRYGKGQVVWGRSLAEALGTAPDFMSDDRNLRFIHRREDGTEIYFVSNQSDRATVARCTFRTTGKVPELWQPDTGRRETTAMYAEHNGRTTLPLALDPFGSVFIVFRRPSQPGQAIASIRSGRRAEFSVASGRGEFLVAPPVLTDTHTTVAVWEPGRYEIALSGGRIHRVGVAALPAAQEIAGPWEMRFPPDLDAPAMATLPRLMSWTESAEDGIRHFSGTAVYLKTIHVSSEQKELGSRLYLDLGEVKNVCEVTLNGRDLGVLWKPPFRVDITAAARVGENRLELKVTNLWPNRLIGDQHRPVEKRITWASYNHFRADDPLLPSGLLGPVVLRTARTLTLSTRNPVP